MKFRVLIFIFASVFYLGSVHAKDTQIVRPISPITTGEPAPVNSYGGLVSNGFKNLEASEADGIIKWLEGENKQNFIGIDNASIDIFKTEAESCVSCTLNYFRKESNKQNPLKGMCEIIKKSEICRSVPQKDLMDCNTWKTEQAYQAPDIFFGCARGVFDSAVSLLKFIWDASKWTVDKAIHPEKTSQEILEYTESGMLYLVNEYDKAYDNEKSRLGRSLKAANAVGLLVADKIVESSQSYLQENFEGFGCLNYDAKSRVMCNFIGEISVPSATALGVFKYGSKAIKTSGKNIDKKTLTKNNKTLQNNTVNSLNSSLDLPLSKVQNKLTEKTKRVSDSEDLYRSKVNQKVEKINEVNAPTTSTFLKTGDEISIPSKYVKEFTILEGSKAKIVGRSHNRVRIEFNVKDPVSGEVKTIERIIPAHTIKPN